MAGYVHAPKSDADRAGATKAALTKRRERPSSKLKSGPTMASQGGGFGRFSRRNKDDTTKTPAPSPAVVTNKGEQLPASTNNDDFASFGGGGDMESFDNVDMFGGSFDMNFESTGNDTTSYDYDMSDFGFTYNEKPVEASNALSVSGSNDSTAVTGTDPSQSTTAMEDSTPAPVVMDKTNTFAFRLNENQGRNPAPHNSPPRPKTAAPQQTEGNIPGAGLAMFASRKRAATSQDPETTEKGSSIDNRIKTNGQSLKPTGGPPAAAPTTSNPKNAASGGSTFTRVLPPPSIAPSKPLQTQFGNTIPSVTPKGTSNKAVFLPGLTDNDNDEFATPSPKNVDTDSSIFHKTGGNATTTIVTPESNATGLSPVGATNTGMSTLQDSTLEDSSFLGSNDAYDGKEADGFDDLLSQFLGDLRSATDLQLHGDAELLDLEVDLARAFARALHDRSDAMDLLDGIEDVHLEADDLILAMQDF